MVYQIDRIVRDVRVCLDQNASSAALISSGDIETLFLEDVIKSKILEGVRRVHTDAPYYLLEGGHNFGDSLYWSDISDNDRPCCGWVLLPVDFLRLVVFEMSDWERAVYSAISTTDDEYALQRSRFKGIRGTPQRPVCAIGVRPEGRVLEFYSCKSNDAHVSRAVYIPYPTIDTNGGVDISERCYDAIVYMIGGLTLASQGDTTRSAALFELSKNNLQ